MFLKWWKIVPVAAPVAAAASMVDAHPELHSDIRAFTETLFRLAAGSLRHYQEMKTKRGLIKARGHAQQAYLHAILKHDISFGVGPAAGVSPALQTDMFGSDLTIAREHQRLGQHVFELAHVAGPVVVHEHPHGVSGHRGRHPDPGPRARMSRTLIANGSGPYFYLPKLESHLEARLWNDVFKRAQEMLGIPQGTIKATVLIETILAAFEMDEILYELKDHSAGLNCGRWDYIFSFIKRFHANPDWVLPDRAEVTMTSHFLRSYAWLLVRTCHRRGAHAMGGMAAQIPIRDDPAADAEAKEKVRQDKEREANDGHDGTWVAHPGLVPVAKAVFDRVMPGPNQIERPGFQEDICAEDLLRLSGQPIAFLGQERLDHRGQQPDHVVGALALGLELFLQALDLA